MNPVFKMIVGLCLAAGSVLISDVAGADPVVSPIYQGILLAQSEGDDAYDPFADYSEFDEASEEEADINFFKHGRFFTLGFIGGYRGWTQDLGNIYEGGPAFGLFLSYFFDLRFALQLGLLTGDYPLRIRTPAETIEGNIGLTSISFDLKYYLNTQNVTRGLADLNPYLIGGFSQIYRTTTVSGNDSFGKIGAVALDLGAGLEIPLMRNKMYFGFQGLYQLVTFPDEGQQIIDSNDDPTGVYPRGDSWTGLLILGVNFQ